MRILAQRWRMAGLDAYAYAVYVPKSDAPAHTTARDAHGNTPTTHLLSGYGMKQDAGFLSYADATVSQEHRAMDQGIERYNDWKQHEANASCAALRIIQFAFPETDTLDAFPLLWVPVGELSSKPTERHTDVWTSDDEVSMWTERTKDLLIY